jgi:hypothetical protein
MFKKTITYEDLNGNKQTEDFYFHMSKAELLEMFAEGDVMMARIKRIIGAKNGKAILHEFRLIVDGSCGMRSEDGARFIKTPEAKSVLLDSPAYDELLMELCTDAGASAEFVNKLIPEKMQKEMQAQLQNLNKDDATVDPFRDTGVIKSGNIVEDARPLWMREERNPTQQELLGMGQDELLLAFKFRK